MTVDKTETLKVDILRSLHSLECSVPQYFQFTLINPFSETSVRRTQTFKNESLLPTSSMVGATLWNPFNESKKYGRKRVDILPLLL